MTAPREHLDVWVNAAQMQWLLARAAALGNDELTVCDIAELLIPGIDVGSRGQVVAFGAAESGPSPARFYMDGVEWLIPAELCWALRDGLQEFLNKVPTLSCDQCGTRFHPAVQVADSLELKCVAYAAGWRFPEKPGLPMDFSDPHPFNAGLCPVCAPLLGVGGAA